MVFKTVKQKGENALPMSVGSLVTTARCILGLQIEEMASIYEG
jgi:hypothetical protein